MLDDRQGQVTVAVAAVARMQGSLHDPAQNATHTLSLLTFSRPFSWHSSACGELEVGGDAVGLHFSVAPPILGGAGQEVDAGQEVRQLHVTG